MSCQCRDFVTDYLSLGCLKLTHTIFIQKATFKVSQQKITIFTLIPFCALTTLWAPHQSTSPGKTIILTADNTTCEEWLVVSVTACIYCDYWHVNLPSSNISCQYNTSTLHPNHCTSYHPYPLKTIHS